MKAFFQAVLMSFRYKWTILGAVVCSLLIAVLWSASISTVFPVVKIVIEGETAQSWISNEIEYAQKQQEELEQQIVADEAQLVGLPPDQRLVLENQLDMKRDRLAGEKKAVATFKRYQPYIEMGTQKALRHISRGDAVAIGHFDSQRHFVSAQRDPGSQGCQRYGAGHETNLLPQSVGA